MVAVDRAGHHDPAGHPGRPGGRRGRGRGRRRPVGDPHATCPRSASASTAGRRGARVGDRCATTWPSAATSTPSSSSTTSACRSSGRPSNELLAAGLSIMDAINAQDRPVHPTRPDITRLPPRLPERPRLDRPALPARDGDPPRLVRPLARAAPAPAPGWPSCTRAVSWPWDTRLRERVVHRHPVQGRLVETTDVGGLPGVVPTDHRPGLDHRHRPVHARPDRPVPGRLPAVSTTADVVVIGAGAVGAACAYFAARRGLRVHVVERGSDRQRHHQRR